MRTTKLTPLVRRISKCCSPPGARPPRDAHRSLAENLNGRASSELSGGILCRTFHSSAGNGDFADKNGAIDSFSERSFVRKHVAVQSLFTKRFISSSLFVQMSADGGSGSETKGLRGEWGFWISKRFSEAEKSKPVLAPAEEPTEAEIRAEVQRSVPAVQVDNDEEDAELAKSLWSAGTKSRAEDPWDEITGDGDRDELVELLEKTEGDDDEDWKSTEIRGSRATTVQTWEEERKDWLGDQPDLTDLKEGGMLSDAAMAAIEEHDLEDLERPYRFRKDRLYFPGQTYEMEDVDLSNPVSVEENVPRTRLTVTPKEALDKADFRNPRFLLQFMTETAKILPRNKSKLTAKAQRKVSRQIRTSRILGLVPFTMIGRPPFRFGRMEDPSM